jgi:2,4-dienoyl-CoA reductase-like NADH-dependent reductase (Old Yellow Enzyme family)
MHMTMSADKTTPQAFSATRGENERRIFQRDKHPHILRPISLRSVTSRNRIVMSPMCQYCAEDALPGDWHFQHLGSRAVGGAGIIITESVHISPDSLITGNSLGLWSEAQCEPYARITRFIKSQGALPGIQLNHAGRKGSTKRPADGGGPLKAAEGGWAVMAPSALPFSPSYPVPREMNAKDIHDVLDGFANSTRLALAAGFEVMEIHAGHGYLLHQFLSPLSNRRQDEYGGTFEKRVRFLLEVITAVRSEWPADKPLFVRISASDWVEGGWDLESSVRLGQLLKAGGQVDLIDCSGGGVVPEQKPVIHPGYLVPFAAAVRSGSGLPTSAVGMIHSADMAETIVANGQADLVCIGRAMLVDPYWALHAARALRAEVAWPVQYERGDIY